MRRAALAGCALAALLAAAGSDGASSPWPRLHRPFHLPVVAPGAPCPVSGVTEFPFARFGVGRGIGPGPAYPIGFAQPGSVLRYLDPPSPQSEFAGSDWRGEKVLWFVRPAYRGPVLIRGRRLDAPGLLRFDHGRVPPAELRLPRVAKGSPGFNYGGQRYRPSYTRVLTAGCYAYQIDGTTFSRVIVFQAKPY